MTDKPVIFVTGGASGIGLAIVEAILAEGWHAMIADSAASHLELAKKRFGDKITCGHTDVTCEDEVRRAIDMCESECGPISGVVNSAGIGRSVSAFDTDIDLFRNMLAVNLLGSFLVARQAAKKMSGRGCGSIVNITSASGIRGNAGRSAYGASKGGVIAMTNVLAVEWAEFAIRVNAIAPGPVDTPLTLKAHSARDRSAWTAAVPLGRYGAPSEIAAAAIFLLDGQKSSYITGQTLCVDGGFTTAGILPSKQSAG